MCFATLGCNRERSPAEMKVVVVGAGAVGAAVSFELARSGAAVTIYERESPASGTSATSFAWVNAHDKHPRAYHDLTVDAIGVHRRLAGQTPGPPAYFESQSLEWAGDAAGTAQLAARVKRLCAWDYPVRWVAPDQARSLEPALCLPPSLDRLACFPLEGYVLPKRFVAGLLEGARHHGALVRAPVSVGGLESDTTGVVVHLDDSTSERADAAVVCAGRWTGSLLGRAGYELPLADASAAPSPALGYLAWTSSLPNPVRRVVLSPFLNVRPDGRGGAVIQAPDLDSGADPHERPTTSGSVARELKRRLAALVAGGGACRIESIRVGQRALLFDGLPACGWLDRPERVYVVVTHSAITLAPLLGQLAAREIVAHTELARLARFRPQRFDPAR